MCPAPCLAPCLALCLFALALTGCSGRAARPDAEVARIIEREDAKRARSAAIAAVDVDPVELASAAVALETLGILYVPEARTTAADAPARAPAAEGWNEGAPASWGLTFVVPQAMDVEDEIEPDPEEVADDEAAGDDESRPGRRRGNGQKRPRVRVQILDMKLKNNPVSFSGSVKNLDSVQFRMTIRM
jgi:hypothetical protein